MSGIDDMIKRMELMHNSQYKSDMDSLALQITRFLDKYNLKGLMGFYKDEQFKISILLDENAVNTNILNP